MALRFRNRSGWLCALVLLGGCSDAVQMARETEQGGVVSYLFKEDRGGPMGSPHRKAALKLIDEKCPSGYTVVRDGEMRGSSSMSAVEGQEGEITNRRWGIQFRCK
jgi:hypothetical protein